MEKYNVLRLLGVGDQGSTYLVEKRETRQLYSLKMIECLDQSHANSAFKEFVEIKAMGQHYLVCDIIEVFLHWNKQMSAVFACVVGTYFPSHNLGSFLKSRNSTNILLAESTVTMWLAEIIEGLSFISNRGIFHRSLKPSNIYLNEKFNHLVIGDLCVPIVFADMKTSSRCVVGSRNWLAPELKDQLTSGEEADVWSVGCIGLKMVLSGVIGVGKFGDRLERIKFSTTELENLLKLSAEYFSTDLISLIRAMLSIDPSMRPSLAALAEDRVVVDGLADGDFVRLRRQQTNHPYQPVPVDVSPMSYFRYITDNMGNEICIGDVLQHMLSLVQSKESKFNIGSANQMIYRAMMTHLGVKRVVLLGLEFLTVHLIHFPNADDIMYTLDVIKFLFEAMKRYSKSDEIQLAILTLLSILACNGDATKIIKQLKGDVMILKTMRLFEGNASICESGLKTLWRLCATAGFEMRMVDHKALNDVVKILKIHTSESGVFEAGFLVIFCLALLDENINSMKDLECLSLIVRALDAQPTFDKVVRNGLLALSALVQADEESAYQMIAREKENDLYHPLQTVMQVYYYQKNDLGVCVSLSTLLSKLSRYEDIASEMEHLNVNGKILNELQKTFSNSPEIFTNCLLILKNMKNSHPNEADMVMPL